jgi:hypothetical protein
MKPGDPVEISQFLLAELSHSGPFTSAISAKEIIISSARTFNFAMETSVHVSC